MKDIEKCTKYMEKYGRTAEEKVSIGLAVDEAIEEAQAEERKRWMTELLKIEADLVCIAKLQDAIDHITQHHD